MDGTHKINDRLVDPLERLRFDHIDDPKAPKLKPRANPSLRMRSTSVPFASSGSRARQSQPLGIGPAAAPLGRGTNTVDPDSDRDPDPDPDPDPERDRACDSSISLPMRENPLDAVSDETDFLSRERGSGGRTSDADADGSAAADAARSYEW